MSQTTSEKPPLWMVIFFFLFGAVILVDAGVTVFGGDCASFEVPGSIQYRALGEGMRTLCERWGPFAPASIEVLVAAGLLAFAGFLARQRWRAVP